jgi:hypothetical protein
VSLVKAERRLERAIKRGWVEVAVPGPYPPHTPFVVQLEKDNIWHRHGATTREDALLGALKKAGIT